MATNASKTEKALAGNNLIIVLILVSVVAVGVTGLVSKFMISRIQRDAKVLDHKSKADKQLSTNVENAPKLVEANKALGPLLTVIDHALPTTSNFPGIIVTFENLATAAGVTLKSVTPGVTNTSGALSAAATPVGGVTTAPTSTLVEATPQKYQFTVTIDSSYDALLAFTKNIELSARPMKVTNLKLSGSTQGMSGQMVIETYYQDKAVLPIGTETIE